MNTKADRFGGQNVRVRRVKLGPGTWDVAGQIVTLDQEMQVDVPVGVKPALIDLKEVKTPFERRGALDEAVTAAFERLAKAGHFVTPGARAVFLSLLADELLGTRPANYSPAAEKDPSDDATGDLLDDAGLPVERPRR